MATNFRCYGCGKTDATKHNLREYDGHLHCRKCLQNKPDVIVAIFKVTFLTKRGLTKAYSFKLPTAEESEAYAIKKYAPREVLSVILESDLHSQATQEDVSPLVPDEAIVSNQQVDDETEQCYSCNEPIDGLSIYAPIHEETVQQASFHPACHEARVLAYEHSQGHPEGKACPLCDYPGERVQLTNLLTAFGNAFISEDCATLLPQALETLSVCGYTLNGYIGAPFFLRYGEIVAMVAFNLNKDDTFNKRNPFTISLSQEEEVVRA